MPVGGELGRGDVILELIILRVGVVCAGAAAEAAEEKVQKDDEHDGQEDGNADDCPSREAGQGLPCHHGGTRGEMRCIGWGSRLERVFRR